MELGYHNLLITCFEPHSTAKLVAIECTDHVVQVLGGMADTVMYL